MLNYRAILTSLTVFIVFLITAQTVAAATAKSKPVSIKFKSAAHTIHVGNTFDSASILTVSPKVKLSYSSNNLKIASIDTKGIVKGLAAGEVTITVNVSQKGYAGKGTFTLKVTEPPVDTTPVTYTDLVHLDQDVRNGIQTLYKKDYNNLGVSEKALRQKLLNIDRKQLLEALHAILTSAKPSKTSVVDFVSNNLEDSIPAIGEMVVSHSDNAKKEAAISMLSGFKSPKAIAAMSTMLTGTTDSSLKYSLCYYLSKFKNNDVALNALISIMAVDTSDMLLYNAVAGAILVADTNPEQIRKLLLSYEKLQPATKTIFTICLSSDPAKSNIYSAWKLVIQASQQSIDTEEKAAADEIWNAVKVYSPYKE